MVTLVNRAKVSTSTTGTGTITLGAAVDGYQTFAGAGATDGQTVRYVIEDGSNFEIGSGVFGLAGGTLTRTVTESSNADAAINLSGTAVVFITATASDIVQPNDNVSTLTNDAGYTTNTGTVTSVAASAGTGISVSGSPITTSGTLTITNTAPDQTVVLTSGTGISATGTYPNFTVTNTAPDQTVVLTQGANVTITGTYPNFTIASTDQFTGTVTSVGGTGTVNGLSLTGAVTTSGNLTLGGTLAISNADWSGTDLAVTNGGTGASSFTANTVLLGNGTSSFQTVAPSTSGNVLTSNGTTWTSVAPAAGSGSLQATASGTLSNGATVIINADGTVSAVTGSAQVLSAATVFESATANEISATFDSNLNKVVIAYRDAGNSSFGTAVVGTVSGASISFGTPVVFESANTSLTSATFDSSSNKVVIAYKDEGNSSFGTAIVGTVSGTSISFGTAVVFSSVDTSNISVTFDSNSNKVVIVHREPVGGFGSAIVGTVSGTSISFGTPVVFEIANIANVSATFDSNSNKVVIAYRDGGNFDFGTAIVGTVSGTSISFGTPVVFESANSQAISATFDSNLNKVVIAYRDGGNSNFGTAIVGTVSGTSISFGTAVVFRSASVSVISVTFDSNLNKVVIACEDNVSVTRTGLVFGGAVSGTSINFDNSIIFVSAQIGGISATFDTNASRTVISFFNQSNANFGTAVVFAPQFTNLTTDNFIGLSADSYADAATATVQLIGSVDDAQSGLTAAQKYFVQVDGTLGTAPTNPEVYAGIAVSATKLIVKG